MLAARMARAIVIIRNFIAFILNLILDKKLCNANIF